MSGGDIAIVPGYSTYGLWGGSVAANHRIIEVKRRGRHKRSGLLMCQDAEREIHVLDRRSRDIVDCITKDYDLPLSVIAPYDPDHPLVRAVHPDFLPFCSANGTMSTGLNAGPFHERIGRLSLEKLHPVFGTSANITGMGTRTRLEDVEPELRAVADLEIDYGLCRFHAYGVASTQINFETMTVSRTGACYELIVDILRRHFRWELPPDQGRQVNPNGLVDEFALLRSAGPAVEVRRS